MTNHTIIGNAVNR